ncbi:sigma factor [Streptomyces fructofermentans]|uniref:RNA polymerase sigma-70 region 2 domain-containing protein n=1 Tax=Streptomyces fructofermentans TaxID=152141 RepID=A0A918KW19_9ACTN|nr:sigma factor [Streptomyces fructofermentans]GGX76191.1 hypothetical protein GCM10010515_49810 [Streptomyces fructofermentans]
MHVETSTSGSRTEEEGCVFAELRPHLFDIAYRVLGSTSDAEDVVREVLLHWRDADRSAVASPAAYLSRTAARLAVDAAESARMRRESYIGPWLPDPVDTATGPGEDLQRAGAVDLALLVVLDELDPTERAACVLREGFAYGDAEIAEILRLSPAGVRTIVDRTLDHLASGPAGQ